MAFEDKPDGAVRKSSHSRLSRLAGCSILALCIPSATHGVAATGQMSVSAIVVEACRASWSARIRAEADSSRTENPPRPEVELTCSQGGDPYILQEQGERPEAVRIESGNDAGTDQGNQAYTTIVF